MNEKLNEIIPEGDSPQQVEKLYKVREMERSINVFSRDKRLPENYFNLRAYDPREEKKVRHIRYNSSGSNTVILKSPKFQHNKIELSDSENSF